MVCLIAMLIDEFIGINWQIEVPMQELRTFRVSLRLQSSEEIKGMAC